MSSDNLDTKPTIETVLERINELGTRLENRIGSLETAVVEMRDEMRLGFHELERRVDVVSIDMNKLRGELRYMDQRIEKLEKAS
jgi:predicted RNase H-like nuclease (RuvC/YqgF family)